MTQRGEQRGESGSIALFAPWVPIAWWAVIVIVLGAVDIYLAQDPGRLDNPDPAYQRAGLLTSTREVQDLKLPGDPIGHRPVVLVFDRRLPSRSAFKRFVSSAPPSVYIALIAVRSNSTQRTGFPKKVVADPSGGIAARVGMSRPKDGGPPIGYAVIDRGGGVRYATLDPAYLQHGFELKTIVKAVS